jgi:thiol-disulfide isomerase/thioredoxin
MILAAWFASFTVHVGCSRHDDQPAAQAHSTRIPQTADAATGRSVGEGADSMGVVPGQPMRRGVPAIPGMPLQPLTVAGSSGEPESIPTLKPGAAAPDFVSHNLTGDEVRLSDWSSRVVVLDFWATWCGPCRASLPHTQEVAKRGKDDGVVVLAICTSDTRQQFEEFVRENQDEYPDIIFTCDPHERGSATFKERASRSLYGVRGIPTQFIVDRSGRIAAVLTGFQEGEHLLENALTDLGVTLGQLDLSQRNRQKTDLR